MSTEIYIDVNNKALDPDERLTLVWNSSTKKAYYYEDLELGFHIEGYDSYKTFPDEAALLLYVTTKGLNLVNEIL